MFWMHDYLCSVSQDLLYIFVVISSSFFIFVPHVGCVAVSNWVGWLEFSVPFQHKYDYIRDEK